MTYPTRAQQFVTADPVFIEKAELDTVVLVTAQTLYPLAVTASNLDHVTCLRRQSVTLTFSGPSTSQTFWCPGAQPLPAGTVTLAASPFTAFTPASVVVTAVTRDVPGAEVVVTWRALVDANSDGIDDGTPTQPLAGAQLRVSYQAYADLTGAVLDTPKTHLDLSGCDMTAVTDTQVVVRYRSKVKPLYSQ